MKEKILTWVAILVLAAAGVLAYCHYRWPELVCLHKWQAATCEQAMQCEKCGKVEGMPIGHDWADTTCTAPSPCSMCGTLEGIELTHTWREDGRICTACGLDERPQEVRFMERLGMSLNERWDYMNGRPWYAVRDKFIWDEFTREELELLTEFQAVEFEDEELGELASRYVETILETEAALVDFGSETWERAYYDWIRHEQNVVLYEISRLYDIEVAEDYQPLLQELIDGGEEITIITQVTDAIRIHMLTSVNGQHNVDAVFENPTERRFARFTIVLEFVSAEGVVVETENINIAPWYPGAEVSRRFTVHGDYTYWRIKSVEWE